jgi:hypothetical protein
MPVLSKPSKAAFTSLTYITLGALIDVWSGIWYVYLFRTGRLSDDPIWYWCYGFLLTGLVLLVIGLAIGRIGRSARHAELPPEEITQIEAKIDQAAASRAPMVVPNPAMAGVAPNGQVMAPVAQVAGVPPVVGAPHIAAVGQPAAPARRT